MKTLLWDIDGTLLTTKGAGALPFKDSIEEFLNCKIQFDRVKQSGLTDHEIVKLHIKLNKLEKTHSHLINEIVDHYAAKLRDTLQMFPVQIYPGIRELLARLKSTSGFDLAIATGNCKLGAQEKLISGDLLKYFDQSRIFCSEDTEPRSEILKRAISGMRTTSQSSIVLGDTLHDWNAARELSIPFILVINEKSQVTHDFATIDCASIGPSWNTLEFEKLIYAV